MNSHLTYVKSQQTIADHRRAGAEAGRTPSARPARRNGWIRTAITQMRARPAHAPAATPDAHDVIAPASVVGPA
jgi:hypothetical protein